MSAARFTRQPATLVRTAEHYYELRADGIVTIGCQSSRCPVSAARFRAFVVGVFALALVALESAVLWHGAVMRLPR